MIQAKTLIVAIALSFAVTSCGTGTIEPQMDSDVVAQDFRSLLTTLADHSDGWDQWDAYNKSAKDMTDDEIASTAKEMCTLYANAESWDDYTIQTGMLHMYIASGPVNDREEVPVFHGVAQASAEVYCPVEVDGIMERSN